MDFQIGDVVSKTFGAVSRNFTVFFLLSLVMVGVPTFLVSLFQLNAYSAGETPFAVNPAMFVIALIVNVAAAYILQGAIIHGAVADFSGKRANLNDCISTGLRHALPLFAVAILVTLGMMLGMMLLIVPGVILAIMWSVAVPVQVAENSGITQALGRSRALTKNNRWKIFGLFVILVILSYVIGIVITVPALALGGPGTIFSALLQTLASVLSSVVGAVGVAALYFQLRSSKEGIGAEALAKVFE
ncbi:MAG: hypothetical protein R3C58_04880 [Parvularculaceae bacterium]